MSLGGRIGMARRGGEYRCVEGVSRRGCGSVVGLGDGECCKGVRVRCVA